MKKRRALILAAAATTAALAGGVALALAQADPEAPATSPAGPPQLDASCPAAFEGTLTALPKQAGDPPNKKNLLECSGGAWKNYSGEYPAAESWLSTDTELVLRGQGMRNPELMAGRWTGSPQSADTTCSAEYSEVHSGKIGDAQTLTAEAGQPLSFDASPSLLNVTLTGYCRWQLDG